MNRFNPNAAPFQPGQYRNNQPDIQYQQPPQRQQTNNFYYDANSSIPPQQQSDYDGRNQSNNVSHSGTIATAAGTRSNRPFVFNPFGYNSQRRPPTQSNGYQQNASYPAPQTYDQGQSAYNNYSQQQQQQLQANYNQHNGFPPLNESHLYPSNTPASSSETYYNSYVAGAGGEVYNNRGMENGYTDNAGNVDREGASSPYNLSQDLFAKMQANENKSALFEIQIGLEQLISESQDFDTWAMAIRDRLVSKDFGREDLILASSIVVEMAVLVADCQYTYSRLCHFLAKSIPSLFTDCLVPVLEDFCYHNSSLLDVDQTKNLLLFLAELYAKFEADGIKSPALASLIIEHINNLLKLDVDGQTLTILLKAVVQALKLVGRFLEGDQGSDVMSEIFAMLNRICCSSDAVNESVKGQILALNQLRENKWGVTNIELTGSTAPTSSIGMIVIGPDGNPLTEEECAFLDENYDNYGSASPGGSYNDALEQDNVVDDYEAFLQATAIRAAEKALEKISFDEDEEESMIGSPKAVTSPSQRPSSSKR